MMLLENPVALGATCFPAEDAARYLLQLLVGEFIALRVFDTPLVRLSPMRVHVPSFGPSWAQLETE